MKNKLIVAAALLLIVAIVALFSWDLFTGRNKSVENVYEYKLDKFKEVDTTTICYKPVLEIHPAVQGLKAVAVDHTDHIYIASEGKVLKYSPSGDSIFAFSIVDSVVSLAVAANGDLFLASKRNVLHYGKNGKLVKKWKEIGRSAYITSVALGDSSVFLADAGNKIVHHYNFTGELIGQIGAKDKDKGIPGFFIPSPYFDVLVDKQNQLWAINSGRHAFEAYTKSGELITRWNRTSMTIEGFSGCCNPSHVALLSDGGFVTSEKGIVRIKIHEKTGDFRCVVASPDQFVDGTTGIDLAVDSKDRIIALDPVKNLVRVYGLGE
jgi:hypothetical protein